MQWRKQVTQLEQEGNFDIAIFLLEKVIKENPSEMDAYIFLLYRFMDSFLENTCYWANSKDPLRKIKEEYYEEKIWHSYRTRAQTCFDESYAKFFDNPEYLYYASRILLHAYDFIGLNIKESLLENMYQKAKTLGYNRLVEAGYSHKPDDVLWAKKILDDSSIREQLASKGAAAQYVIGEMVDCAKKILKK